MKDYTQIEHINKYIEERMKHCYTNVCDKLGVQIDDMDAYGAFYVPLNCPLDTTKEGESK